MVFVSFNSNMAGVTIGKGTTNHYRRPTYIPPRFIEVCVAKSLVFDVVF